MRYARDAFEGLRLMDALMAVKRGEPGAALPALRERRVQAAGAAAADRRRPEADAGPLGRRPTDNPIPTPPFWGNRVVKGIPLADYASLPRRAGHVHGPVGPAGPRRRTGRRYEELVETDGRPRLRMWLDRLQTEGLLEAAVVYGYFPLRQQGRRPDRARTKPAASAPGSRSRASAATGGCAWPTSSGPRTPARPTWSASAGHGRRADQRGHRRAVRGERLPRLPGAARPVGPAHRGAGRVLARPGPRGARLRRRSDPADVEEYFKLGYRGAGSRSATAPARTWRTAPRSSAARRPSGSASSCPRSSSCTRAVHRRDHRAPPRGEVLQHLTGVPHPDGAGRGRARAAAAGRAVRHGRAAGRLRAALVRGRVAR